MKKKVKSYAFQADGVVKLWRIMRLTFFILMIGLLEVSASVYSQQTKLSMNLNNVTLKDAFSKIEDSSNFVFFYNAEQVDLAQKVSVNAENRSVEEILDALFASREITYKILDRRIVLYPKGELFPLMVQQTVSLTGIVTNTSGEPVPGATIVVKGTTNGTISDFDGKYTLSTVPANSTIVISFVGLKSQEIAVNGQTIINVELELETIGVDEVVAIGYATQRKVNLTGAISSIDAEKISSRPITQTSSAIQGLAPGVVVTQNLGTPGNDASTIRIRGQGSISSSLNPLIMVDGIQVGSINDVNPEDIENISVLKDAASAAIYGSRAANGVILITTKRGSKGKFSVSGDFSYGAQAPTMLPNFVSLKDQMMLEDVDRYNRGLDLEWSAEAIAKYTNEIATNGPSDAFQNNDWYKLVVKSSSPIHREQFVFSGGSEMVQARVSIANLNQDGLIDNSSFNRKSIRSNIDITPTDWLKFNSDIYIQRTTQESPTKNIVDLFHEVNELEPYRQAIVGDGLYGWGWKGENPVAHTQSGGLNRIEGEYTLANFNALINPVKGLKIDLGYSNMRDNSYITSFTESFDFYAELTSNDDPLTLDGKIPSKNGMKKSTNRITQNYYKAVAMYEKMIEEHSFSGMLGADAVDFSSENLFASRIDFPFGIDYPQLGLGGTEGMNNGSKGFEWSMASVFGRVNYQYKSRYLLEASFRYDGSSRFSKDYRWGLFPAISVGWRISEESFLKDVDYLSNLKLRASWGQLGNQDIGNYPYQSLTDIEQSVILNETRQQGAAITEWAVNDIGWEKSQQLDFGVDFGFLNNKLNGSFDYYTKNNTDILLKLQLPKVSGLSANYQNGAAMENKGWELILNWADKIGKVGYNITAQLDDNKNKVTSLLGTGPYINENTIQQVGSEFNALYGYMAEDGFMTKADLNDPNVPKWDSNTIQEGSLKMKDISGPDGKPDGKIDVNDRVVIGSSAPRYNYSFICGGNYNGFSIDVILQGVGKRQGYIRREGEYYGNHLYDWESDFYIGEDHPVLTQHGYDAIGLKPNVDAKYPASGVDNGGFSDFWLKSRAYLRIKNITLGYTLPKNVTQNLGLNRVKFYLSFDNVYTFHNFIKGFDPENADGKGYFQYPNISKYMGGVSISF